MKRFLKKFNFSESKNSKISSSKNRGFYDELARTTNVEGFYGLVSKLPNPDIVLKKTGKGIATLRQLTNEGQVATCIASRKAGVSSLDWGLIFPDGDEKRKEFYDNILEKIDVHNLISEILDAPAYGHQPIEIVWEVVDSFIEPKEIIAKPQEWFHFNSDRKLCFKQKGSTDGVELSDDLMKFVCPRHESSYINPYGIGYLSRCFWDVVFIKGGMEFWIKFIEKYGMPYFIGKYEDGAKDSEKEELLDNLEAMVQDAVAVIPNNSTVEIKDAAGKSASAQIYAQLIKICKDNISKNILGQTMTTDIGSSGSYAAGKVHAEVRDDIVKSDSRLVMQTMNKILDWIHEINFADGKAPKFKFKKEENTKKTVAERDEILSKTGIKFTSKYYQKTYGFAEEDILLEDKTSKDNKNGSEFSESKTAESGQDKIDKLIDCFSDEELDMLFDNSIKPVVEHFSDTKDPESTYEKLSEIYPSMDSRGLEEMLTKAIFISNLWGRAE